MSDGMAPAAPHACAPPGAQDRAYGVPPPWLGSCSGAGQRSPPSTVLLQMHPLTLLGIPAPGLCGLMGWSGPGIREWIHGPGPTPVTMVTVRGAQDSRTAGPCIPVYCWKKACFPVRWWLDWEDSLKPGASLPRPP